MRSIRLTNSEIALFCQELSLLLHAGVEPGSGIVLLAEDTKDPGLRTLLDGITLSIDEGLPLWAALAASGAFPDYVSRLLHVGEETGRTEEALEALALYYDRQERLTRRLKSALLYPAVLMLVMVVVMVVLLTKVLPVFNDVYGRLGGALTGLAGGLLSLGQGLNAMMPVLCVLLALVLALLAAFALSDGFRQQLAALWTKSRGDKGLSKKLHTARFAQALSMGLSSGLSPEEALELAGALLADLPLAENCRACSQKLALGAPMARTLDEFDLLPAAQCRLLEMAQRGGSGDRVMEQIAQHLAQDSDDALEARLGLIEPAMVLTTSILIGLVLLSVMLPLLHIMSAMG